MSVRPDARYVARRLKQAAFRVGRALSTRARTLARLRAAGVVTMGEHSYGTPFVHVWESRDGRTRHGGRVFIGRFVSIGKGVNIFTGGDHRLDWVTTYPLRTMYKLPGADHDGHPASKGDVTIGSDVWIGIGATILSGVTIGDGAVVGAQAVVASDVRPYAIVVGNPAKEVGRRFDDAKVESLLALRWWDWPDEEIFAKVDLLCGATIETFLAQSSGQIRA